MAFCGQLQSYLSVNGFPCSLLRKDATTVDLVNSCDENNNFQLKELDNKTFMVYSYKTQYSLPVNVTNYRTCFSNILDFVKSNLKQ